HPARVWEDIPDSFSHRYPLTTPKGNSTTAMRPKRPTRNTIVEAHPGHGRDRTVFRKPADPPRIRKPASAMNDTERMTESRRRIVRRRRAIAWRPASNPQASTATGSLPQLRIGPRLHQDPPRVRGRAGLRDHDLIGRHQGVRQGDRLALAREHSDEVAAADVRRKLRDARDCQVRAMADRIDRGVLHNDSWEMD